MADTGGMSQRARTFKRSLAAVVLTFAFMVPSASAATSVHLTTAGWRSLSSFYAVQTGTSLSQCHSLAAGSRDEQAEGIEGICIDDVDLGTASNHLDATCSALSPRSQYAACATAIAREDDYPAAAAAWSKWFTGQLGGGTCQSFFAGLEQAESAIGQTGARVVADFRHAKTSDINVAMSAWTPTFDGQSYALGFNRATFKYEMPSDARSCNPVG